jgi:iron complex outermembrane receptor protein
MRIVASLLIGTSLVALATPVAAQTAQEDAAQAANPQPTEPTTTPDPMDGAIIVTATKRASTVQDVPFSVNAQTQKDIQRANAQTIEDISRNVAGLAVQNLGPGQSQVSVRGVSAGQIVRDQPGVKEQVGVYLDESVISLSLFTPDLDLFDLNRVETLRGPQGTLFGSGSVGGTLRYITNQPRLDRYEGLAEANINMLQSGDLGYHFKTALNAPMSSTVAMRIVGYHTHFGGFIDAKGPAGGENVNSGSRTGGRFSLLWQPITELKLTPRIVYQEAKANGFNRAEFYNLYSNEFTVPAYNYGRREQYLLLREQFRDKTRIADLTASYDAGPVELTSITSFIRRNILVSRDASALTGSVSVDIGFPAEGVNLPSNLRDTTKLKQFTQEARLSSTGTGPLEWVLGAFYSKVKRTYEQRLPTPGYAEFLDAAFGEGTSAGSANGFPDLDSPYNADIPYDITQKAVFGEATYRFNQFKLTGGGRFYDFKETRDFINGGFFSPAFRSIGDTTKSSGFSPRVIASYEPNRSFSVNLQAAKGFRLGGINDPLNLPLCSPADAALYGPFATKFYEDETLWNYEAGVKYSRGPLTFNSALFHTRMKNLQVTVDAGGCSSRLVFNVPKAHTTGIEAELSARAFPGLDLSVNGSYVNAEFDSTISNPALATATGIREGNRLPSVPRLQLAAAATYTTRFISNADWYINASYQHVGSRYTQPGDQENNPRTFVHGLPFNGQPATAANTVDLKLPAYNLVNLSSGLAFDSGLEVVAYVNNLFDANPKLSFDRERGGRARLGYNVGQPRTMGLTLRQAFRSEPAPVVPVAAPLPPVPPATQTCPDGSVVAATAACPPPPAPPAPPPPASGERG